MFAKQCLFEKGLSGKSGIARVSTVAQIIPLRLGDHPRSPMERFGLTLETTVWYTVQGVFEYYQDKASLGDICSFHSLQDSEQWVPTWPMHDVGHSVLLIVC